MLAKINGLFRLTRDMEVRFSQSGNAIGSMGVACSEKYGDKETQLFLDATCFGKTAEILQQYAGTKGTQIYLSGKLQTESWDDKTTGQKRSKTAMIIEGFDFVSGNRQQGDSQQQTQQAPQRRQLPPAQPSAQYAPNDFESEEIPF